MPGFIDSFLSALAPHLRTGGLGLLGFIVLCILVSSLGYPKLNKVVGFIIIGIALTFSMLMILTHSFGHANEIPGHYTADGCLILYGIIWPLLGVVTGASIIDRERRAPEENKSSED